ncbi:discoidin domain-containing protein [Paenibacillus sp. 1P07SE]|uniref:discoidin domain-containing protein n=1 Tax=Paenibacillus sp. 1P07SE TaxID=3132209 RepID=UPI0039A6A79E
MKYLKGWMAVLLLGMVFHWQPENVSANVQHSFYVSPAGNDATGNGSQQSPWRTMQKARDHIRQNGLNQNMSGDIMVYFAAGDYYVSEPIVFGPADSGSGGYNVVYANQHGRATARFIGGQPITGWQPHCTGGTCSSTIYKAQVGTGWDFHTLYENDQRAMKARHPNRTSTTSFAGYLSTDGGVVGSIRQFQYKAGDLTPGSWDLSQAEVVIWSGDKWDWFTDTVPIQSVNTGTRTVTFTRDVKYPTYQDGQWNHVDGSRYFVQGSLDFLDRPGEFHLDKTTGTLYYYARDGAIGDQTIIAPKVMDLIRFEGASESQRVHHIRLQGLSFEMTDFTNSYRAGFTYPGETALPHNGGESHIYPEFDLSAEMHRHRHGMIFMENTNNIALRENRLRNSGYSAVFMIFYNQNTTIEGNLIEHSGYSGIMLKGKYPAEGDVLRNNVFTNNYIHHVGELVGHASGVSISNAGSNEVSYSEINNTPRYAVNWSGRVNIPQQHMYVKDNEFKYLKIYNAALDSGDTAPIYAWGLGPNAPYLVNTVDQVTIDNVYADPSMTDVLPNAVFMDNDAEGQIMRNILATNYQHPLAFRNNQSSVNNHTNVSWNSGFNMSQMDLANIGLKSTFPLKYRVQNLAQYAAVTASGSQQGFGSGRAIDGLGHTGWRASAVGSAAQPQWILIDLGADKTFNNVDIAFADPDQHAFKYRVEVRGDGVTGFTTVVDQTANQMASLVRYHRFADTTARYVRIAIVGSSQNNTIVPGINEVNIRKE